MLTVLALLALNDVSRGFGSGACVIGDVDRDGTRDVLLPEYVGREWTPAGATILSGADGSALYSIDLAAASVWSASAMSDLDGDHCADFAVVSRSGESRLLTAWSAALGRALWTRPIASSADTYSQVRAAADDDCDGTGDVWIEVGRYDTRGLTRVTLLSGRDGHVLREEAIDHGEDLAPIGDVDGDGRTDMARIVLDCRRKALHVEILESRRGFRPREIGTVNVACTWDMRVHDLGDLDGDGLHDVGVSELEHGVHVFSTSGAGLLFEHEIDFDYFRMTGYASDLRGLVDAAGRAYVLVGVEYAGGSSGEVEVWSVAERRLAARIRAPDNREVHFGARIEPLDDLDHDGRPDFLCIPNHSACGEPNSLYACSTRTGASLWFATGHGSSYSVVRHRAAIGFRADPRAGKRVLRDGRFGMRSCAIGDFDGDGTRELLVVTAEQASVDALGLVLSGADGHVLGQIDLENEVPIPYVRGLDITRAVALADLDGDGADDFGIERRDDTWRRERWFTAYSTCTGLPLWTLAGEPDEPRFEPVMETVCDENRDGRPDVLVAGAVLGYGDGATLATILSGADGRPLRGVPARRDDFGDHLRFVAIGDADGDRITDVARAAATTTQIELTWRSSRDGGERACGVVPYDPRGRFGIVSIPDVDEDGAPDFAVWMELVGFRIVSSRSGRTIAEELDRHDRGWSHFCSALAVFLDRDGSAALLVSARNEGMFGGCVTRRGVTSKTQLFARGPDGDEWHFGAKLALFDDVDRDGTPDFVAVSDHSRCGLPGCVYLCSGRDGRTLWVARATERGVELTSR